MDIQYLKHYDITVEPDHDCDGSTYTITLDYKEPFHKNLGQKVIYNLNSSDFEDMREGVEKLCKELNKHKPEQYQGTVMIENMGSYHGDEDEIDNDYQRRKEEKQESQANEDDWRDYE